MPGFDLLYCACRGPTLPGNLRRVGEYWHRQLRDTGLGHNLECPLQWLGKRRSDPDDFAVRKAAPADLKGGSKARNLEIAHAVLAGERGAHRDIVIANSAVALVAVAQVETFLEGAAVAAVSIDSGAARNKLEALARFTQACA